MNDGPHDGGPNGGDQNEFDKNVAQGGPDSVGQLQTRWATVQTTSGVVALYANPIFEANKPATGQSRLRLSRHRSHANKMKSWLHSGAWRGDEKHEVTNEEHACQIVIYNMTTTGCEGWTPTRVNSLCESLRAKFPEDFLGFVKGQTMQIAGTNEEPVYTTQLVFGAEMHDLEALQATCQPLVLDVQWTKAGEEQKTRLYVEQCRDAGIDWFPAGGFAVDMGFDCDVDEHGNRSTDTKLWQNRQAEAIKNCVETVMVSSSWALYENVSDRIHIRRRKVRTENLFYFGVHALTLEDRDVIEDALERMLGATGKNEPYKSSYRGGDGKAVGFEFVYANDAEQRDMLCSQMESRRKTRVANERANTNTNSMHDIIMKEQADKHLNQVVFNAVWEGSAAKTEQTLKDACEKFLEFAHRHATGYQFKGKWDHTNWMDGKEETTLQVRESMRQVARALMPGATTHDELEHMFPKEGDDTDTSNEEEDMVESGTDEEADGMQNCGTPSQDPEITDMLPAEDTAEQMKGTRHTRHNAQDAPNMAWKVEEIGVMPNTKEMQSTISPDTGLENGSVVLVSMWMKVTCAEASIALRTHANTVAKLAGWEVVQHSHSLVIKQKEVKRTKLWRRYISKRKVETEDASAHAPTFNAATPPAGAWTLPRPRRVQRPWSDVADTTEQQVQTTSMTQAEQTGTDTMLQHTEETRERDMQAAATQMWEKHMEVYNKNKEETNKELAVYKLKTQETMDKLAKQNREAAAEIKRMELGLTAHIDTMTDRLLQHVAVENKALSVAQEKTKQELAAEATAVRAELMSMRNVEAKLLEAVDGLKTMMVELKTQVASIEGGAKEHYRQQTPRRSREITEMALTPTQHETQETPTGYTPEPKKKKQLGGRQTVTAQKPGETNEDEYVDCKLSPTLDSDGEVVMEGMQQLPEAAMEETEATETLQRYSGS